MATSSSTSVIFFTHATQKLTQLHETVENVHKAWAAVSLAKASFTSSFLTKSLALVLIVGHGFSRKSGFFFSTWVVTTKNQTQNK
jgi:cytochrome b